jgi:hypothetical protein
MASGRQAAAEPLCTLRRGSTMETGLSYEFENGPPAPTSLADIQTELKKIGIGVWPLPLDDAPDGIQGLLGQPSLTEEALVRLRSHFLLSRERLLQVIAESGRTPHVPGGGALETSVVNEGYSYPQLWLVEPGTDYTRFDRFHVNVAEDGTGVDEVLQVLSGRGVVVRRRGPDGNAHTLRLDCPNDRTGWMVSYNGGEPHIGSLSGAAPGTKVVVQVIGPERWKLLYVEDEG